MKSFLLERKPAMLLRGLVLASMLGIPAAGAGDSLDVLTREVESLRVKVEQLESVKVPAPSTSRLRLIDTSVDVLVAAGASTEESASSANLQGGGHDPKRRGFTLDRLNCPLQVWWIPTSPVKRMSSCSRTKLS